MTITLTAGMVIPFVFAMVTLLAFVGCQADWAGENAFLAMTCAVLLSGMVFLIMYGAGQLMGVG